MNKKNKVKIIIMKILFSASTSKLDSFSVFKRTRVSFTEFSRNLNSLKENGYVYIDGIILSLTNTGRDYLLLNNEYLEEKNKDWRKVPVTMLGPKLDLNYKYVPSIRLLDKKLKVTLDK
ncbi:hypothetical protein RMS97_003402 [Serratia marcescens]|uniref:hypothetical protein n=1 Tax=Serratia TaxID=613 RepID=UPI00055E4F09|nr:MULTISPECIES: hypothetical protein [Serratia]EIM8482894.1 hypothetical protein [Serratia marcescens]EIU9511641.1 hypothetical protein [Serratia marcescens]ELE6465736.1 hypothetical protein [Serratia marcescens]MBH2622304.1 hypothetical protein [Serratia marcescens]CAI0926739.1 Uncharacterised protein [Serratia quinivorans]